MTVQGSVWKTFYDLKKKLEGGGGGNNRYEKAVDVSFDQNENQKSWFTTGNIKPKIKNFKMHVFLKPP